MIAVGCTDRGALSLEESVTVRSLAGALTTVRVPLMIPFSVHPTAS